MLYCQGDNLFYISGLTTHSVSLDNTLS